MELVPCHAGTAFQVCFVDIHVALAEALYSVGRHSCIRPCHQASLLSIARSLSLPEYCPISMDQGCQQRVNLLDLTVVQSPQTESICEIVLTASSIQNQTANEFTPFFITEWCYQMYATEQVQQGRMVRLWVAQHDGSSDDENVNRFNEIVQAGGCNYGFTKLAHSHENDRRSWRNGVRLGPYRTRRQ